MAEVVILRPGYSRSDPTGVTRASGTISLVLSEGGLVLVDTGGPAEARTVLAALSARSVAPTDIAFVVFTHGHIDHVGNANLFPRATFLAGQDRADGDCFSPLVFGQLMPDVTVVATPGHTSEDVSLLVRTSGGLVAIAGDVFENGDPSDEAWRDVSRDPELQARSRAALLERADLIVPGHGDIFATATYSRH